MTCKKNRSIEEKFTLLGVEFAPGQEGRLGEEALPAIGDPLPGHPVDFSHGDVDAHPPIPGALEAFSRGFEEGGAQAYTEYRGRAGIRHRLAERLSALTGRSIDADEELILTPGTQGALFLAMGSLVATGDKVAYVEPDYFANRKMIDFFEGEKMPVPMRWMQEEAGSGIDLDALQRALEDGARLFLFSNPNNPTGAVASEEELRRIAELCNSYDASVIADELYSRQMYEGATFTHFAGLSEAPRDTITIIGPSKTESMSGFRLGVAFGPAHLIARMEQLQAISTLRCSGYNQGAFADWLAEPAGWLAARIVAHEAIRNDLVSVFRSAGFEAKAPRGGSYLFVQVPSLAVSGLEFVALLRQQAGVIVTPGTEFGDGYETWFRLNFSQDHAHAVAAAERIVELARRYGFTPPQNG